jgi:hypothetical protein
MPKEIVYVFSVTGVDLKCARSRSMRRLRNVGANADNQENLQQIVK